MRIRKLELLAPAGTSAIGTAAIDHGADAVYIGAPRFGARAAAANTIDDIRRLTDHAHQFRARVYVALNTLLNDDEYEEALDIIYKLYDIGVDALIVQDMGLLECDLPPLPLHASTQCDNRTPEKVRFLQDVGFSQVVLARELSLDQISRIRATTTVPLEFFVHGALCVSYSGRCLISERIARRSANRGECAQFCRHCYTLRDGNGKTLEKDSYLLSLRDLNLSNHLRQLIAAGIDSFKIEGRLKDENYVKNVTAFYRLALDRIIDEDHDLQRSSSGRCAYVFTPDPERTFHRGDTDYFLVRERSAPGSPATPKSVGKMLGHAVNIADRSFEIETEEPIAAGDGLCFFDNENKLIGIRANKVDGARIFPKDLVLPQIGQPIYRNLDTAFNRTLQQSRRCRKIEVALTLRETPDGLGVAVEDEDRVLSLSETPLVKEESRNPQSMREIIERQLKKSGDTIFAVRSVAIELGTIYYLPAAMLNDIRRRALDAHLLERIRTHPVISRKPAPNDALWNAGQPPPRSPNSRKTDDFFRRHGIPIESPISGSDGTEVLMTCRYCLKAQLELCPRENRRAARISEPLTLTDNTGTYELRFDCKACEMQVMLRRSRKKRRR